MMVVEPTKLRRKAMKPVPAPTMRPARGRTSARTLRGLKTRAVPTNMTMNPTRRRSQAMKVFSDWAAANMASLDCTPLVMRAMLVP